MDQFNETQLFWKNSISDSNDSGDTSPMLVDDDIINYECYSKSSFPSFAITDEKGNEEVPTTCLVCGVYTNNYHYDVSSCNGCKTFFRRCVVLSKFYECKRSRQCDIRHNIEGNPCKGCRLGKCIAIGMNPTAIQFPKHIDVDIVLQKFEDFRRTILPHYLSITAKVNSPQENLVKEMNELVYIEVKLRRLRESTYNPDYYLNGSIRDILSQSSIEIAKAENYEKPKEWPLSNDEITAKIVEKIKLMIITGKGCNRDKKNPERKRFWQIIDNILVIDAAKTLPFFHMLDISDQTILLKHISLVNTTLMEGFYSFKNKYDTIVWPDGTTPFKFQQIKKEIFEHKLQNDENKNVYYNDNIIEHNVTSNENIEKSNILEIMARKQPSIYFDSLQEFNYRVLDPFRRVNITEKEYVLLKTLIYCYNAIPELSQYAREILQREANKYSQLLLRYLQLEYGEFQGASKYAELISLISVFFNMAERHRQMYLLNKIAKECSTNARKSNCKLPDIFHEIMHAN
uniref:Nuclear receptor n=1 Tax=Acrobeloides nanus TaxID=290746 RepID=A0A914DZP5_9BILA